MQAAFTEIDSTKDSSLSGHANMILDSEGGKAMECLSERRVFSTRGGSYNYSSCPLHSLGLLVN